MRLNNLAAAAVDVFIEEETSNDTETEHLKETLGFLCLEAPNTIAV